MECSVLSPLLLALSPRFLTTLLDMQPIYSKLALNGPSIIEP